MMQRLFGTRMKFTGTMVLLAALALVSFAIAGTAEAPELSAFTKTFRTDNCKLRAKGRNDFFRLTPGYSQLLKGEEDNESVKVLITVLRKTKVVDGVRCRVVREKEWADGELVEISWNYFAICKKHRGVFYFGEDVDIYEDGRAVSHEGAWRSGKGGAKFGMIMPGYPLVGSRYYQEMAPGVAMDRAKHLSITATAETPAGTFEDCLMVVETTALDPEERGIKIYAPGVGLVQDETLQLVEHGFTAKDDLEDDQDH